MRDDALLVLDEDGVQCWHGVMSDITQQKEVEAELERRAAQQAAVARLGEHALEGASLSDLMQEAVTAAIELLDVDFGAVMELVAERDVFVFRAMRRPSRAARQLRSCPVARRSLAGYTLGAGAPVVVSDWEHGEALRGVAEAARGRRPQRHDGGDRGASAARSECSRCTRRSAA